MVVMARHGLVVGLLACAMSGSVLAGSAFPRSDLDWQIYAMERSFTKLTAGMSAYAKAQCTYPSTLASFTPSYVFSPPESQVASWSVGYVGDSVTQQGYVCLQSSAAGEFAWARRAVVNAHSGLVSGNSCPLSAAEALTGDTEYLTWWGAVKTFPVDCL